MSAVASSSSHTVAPELAASSSGSGSGKAKGKGKAPAAPKPKVKAGSNWAALKPKVTDPAASKKRKRPAGEGAGNRLSFEAGDEAEDVEKTFQRYVGSHRSSRSSVARADPCERLTWTLRLAPRLSQRPSCRRQDGRDDRQGNGG
jgi:hypothetical protein